MDAEQAKRLSGVDAAAIRCFECTPYKPATRPYGVNRRVFLLQSIARGTNLMMPLGFLGTANENEEVAATRICGRRRDFLRRATKFDLSRP